MLLRRFRHMLHFLIPHISSVVCPAHLTHPLITYSHESQPRLVAASNHIRCRGHLPKTQLLLKLLFVEDIYLERSAKCHPTTTPWEGANASGTSGIHLSWDLQKNSPFGGTFSGSSRVPYVMYVKSPAFLYSRGFEIVSNLLRIHDHPSPHQSF